MADNLNIIKSKIVSNNWDVFWEQNTQIEELEKKTVVLSLTFQPGSAEEAQLLKMLQACALTAADYHIIHLAPEQQIAWHQVRDKVKPEFVIILGIMPQQLGISAMFRLNEPNRFNDCVFIPTLSLPELEQQPEAKKQLWLSGLKPVFVDKQFEKQR